MEENDINGFLIAYRRGATADYIQPRLHECWGDAWTFPPCEPAAAERAGRQMVRMGATQARWIRRARLRGASGTLEVVIATQLPSKIQEAWEIHGGKSFELTKFLVDQSTDALLKAFQP